MKNTFNVVINGETYTLKNISSLTSCFFIRVLFKSNLKTQQKLKSSHFDKEYCLTFRKKEALDEFLLFIDESFLSNGISNTRNLFCDIYRVFEEYGTVNIILEKTCITYSSRGDKYVDRRGYHKNIINTFKWY